MIKWETDEVGKSEEKEVGGEQSRPRARRQGSAFSTRFYSVFYANQSPVVATCFWNFLILTLAFAI